jgi:predicted RNase H-like HicB family nuclease
MVLPATMKRTFTVVLERDTEGGFVAHVAELPGCISQGETLEEVRSNIREAIELYLEDAEGPFPEFVGIERVEVET